MAANPEDRAFELPKLRVSIGFENDTRFLSNNDKIAEFFDVKFCPFQPLDCDAVCAAVSKKHIVLCRLSKDSGDLNPCEVINMIRDDDMLNESPQVEAASCCCTWTRDPVTGDPYLCVGGRDAKVKIYDPVNGRLVDCFVGHGGEINDLATSPVDPSIIASASNDTSVRIWSIDPRHRKQPCLCVLAGEGHSWSLLSLAFHDGGRYLLSAGHDQVINLWTVPDLPTDPVKTPLQVHYPHFSTSAIHSGIVDCVAFYGDLILSRACHENAIVLWRIEGFSSDGPPPSQSSAPTPQNVGPTAFDDPGRLTRSAFVPVTLAQCPVQYTRLLEFHTPMCGPQFFMRFKLLHVPDQNPVLAFCNAAGYIFFWDLKRLEAYHDFVQASNDPHRDRKRPVQRPSWQKLVIPRQRAGGSTKARSTGSDRESSITMSARIGSADDSEYSQDTLEAWTKRYSIEDAREPLQAHKSESSLANFVGRQAAWSPGGEWCVIVGSSNTVLILQRWATKAVSAHPNPINGT